MKLNFSLDAAVFIAFVTAILYLVGQAYLDGYISVFGADIFILNLSIQDKLTFGYIKSLLHTIFLMIVIILLFIVIPFFFKEFNINYWLFNKLNHYFRFNKKEKKHVPSIHNSSKLLDNIDEFDRKFVWTYAILIILVALPFYIVYIGNDAKEDAQKKLEKYSKNLPRLELKNNPSKEAYKILCGQNLCAVLVINGKEKSLEYFDTKDISFPLKSSNK